MQIQPPINTGPAAGLEGVNFPTSSGGTSPGAGEGFRADWNVRMNISHSNGFVGGAGRVLIQNQLNEERTELVLLLPAALTEKPGNLELASAVVCSAKPGTPATPGQSLAFRSEGAKVVVTIPVLHMNDWVYIDLTWTGSFTPEALNFPNARIPIGDFHPQVAVNILQPDGRSGLAPVNARYDVELGSDPGARVQFEDPAAALPATRPSEDGTMTMHDFKSYGSSSIKAVLLPPGTINESAGGSSVTTSGVAEFGTSGNQFS